MRRAWLFLAAAAWLAAPATNEAAVPAGADSAPAPALGFAEAVALAARQNASVQVAQLRVGEANARVAQSRAAFLPSVTAQATMTDRTFNLNALGMAIPGFPRLADPLIGPVWESEARIRVTQTVLDLSSWQKLRGARLGALAARADQAGSAETAAQAAGLAYLRAARAAALVHARDEDLTLARDLQTLAEAQLEAGTSPNIDATRARTQVAVSRGAVLMARNASDRARIELARVLGLDPASPPALADTLSEALGASAAPGETDAAVAFALANREEVRGEQARADRARADRSATLLERLPRLDVSGDWGSSGEHYGDAIATRTYAAALTLPIVDGLRREGRLREQGELLRESLVREKDLRDQITAETSGALLDLSSGLEQLGVAAEQLRLAEEEVAQSRERFTSGIAGNIEVIEAQASLLRARDADINARFAVASARVALARAAGVARGMR
ncbi:MAG: TolC family protein [Candidatus Eisenbacteria bacterium]|nr:TolC family protein [Candidatus Eisenbacteria bacterium]